MNWTPEQKLALLNAAGGAVGGAAALVEAFGDSMPDGVSALTGDFLTAASDAIALLKTPTTPPAPAARKENESRR